MENFNAWAIVKGLVLSRMTPQAIADEFYRADVHDCSEPLPTLGQRVALNFEASVNR